MTSYSPHPAAVLLAAAVIVNAAVPQLAEAQRRTAEPFDWQGTLAPGQSLEIKGVNGTIRAVAAVGRTASVSAIRSGRRSDPNEVEIVVVEHGSGVTICAVYPSSFLRQSNECLPGDEGRISSRNNDVQVQFELRVPASVALLARTTNGSVEAEGISGPVEARSTNGDIEVDGGERVMARTTNGSISILSAGEADARTTNGRITARLQSVAGSGPLNFSTTNGTITLALPADANLNIDASTSNGSIASDLPITVQGRIGRNRLSGSIGSGGREVRIRTTNGGIRLERA